MKNNTMRRVAAAAAVTSVSAVALASLGAGNAAAAMLPNKVVTQKLADGTSVTVSLTDQSYSLTPSVAAVPTSRHALVSGKVRVSVNGKSEGGNITAGYYVGCQVSFGASSTTGGSANAGIAGTGNIDGQPDNPVTTANEYQAPIASKYAPNPSVSGAQGISLTLGPGATGFVPVINYKDDAGNAVTSAAFKGSKAGVAYSQVDFSIEKCAGYAEAKAYVTVAVSTASVDGYVTLAGKPFSLG